MSEVDDYLDAVAAFATIDRRTDEMRRRLATVAEALDRNRLLSYAPSGSETILRRPDGSPQPWFALDEISDALKSWSAAKASVENAWQNVPSGRQTGLKGPQDHFRRRG